MLAFLNKLFLIKSSLIMFDELILLFGEDFFNDIINKSYDSIHDEDS